MLFSSRSMAMSATKRLKQSKKAGTGSTTARTSEASPVVSTTDGIRIMISAKPCAKESAVSEVTTDTIFVQIAAPARDGEANAELQRFLASILGLKKTNLTLDKGQKSKEKIICVDNSCGLTPDDILSRLNAAVKRQ